MYKLIRALCALSIAMSASAVGYAQDIKEHTFKFSFGQAKEHPAQRFQHMSFTGIRS